MQPDKASAVMAAIIGNRNARATRTLAIPHSETAPVLHRLWLTNRFLPINVNGRCGRPKRPHSAPGQATATARSGADAGADRAGHAGAAKPAIAGRILGQILLMIVLGEIEFAGGRNLRGDGTEPLCRQRLLVGGSRCVGGFALRVAESVDRGTILGADVVALAHALGRVVTFPERLEQLVVRDLPGIEHHQHRFGMAGAARTTLLVSRVPGMAAGVADGGGV